MKYEHPHYELISWHESLSGIRVSEPLIHHWPTSITGRLVHVDEVKDRVKIWNKEAEPYRTSCYPSIGAFVRTQFAVREKVAQVDRIEVASLPAGVDVHKVWINGKLVAQVRENPFGTPSKDLEPGLTEPGPMDYRLIVKRFKHGVFVDDSVKGHFIVLRDCGRRSEALTFDRAQERVKSRNQFEEKRRRRLGWSFHYRLERTKPGTGPNGPKWDPVSDRLRDRIARKNATAIIEWCDREAARRKLTETYLRAKLFGEPTGLGGEDFADAARRLAARRRADEARAKWQRTREEWMKAREERKKAEAARDCARKQWIKKDTIEGRSTWFVKALPDGPWRPAEELGISSIVFVHDPAVGTPTEDSAQGLSAETTFVDESDNVDPNTPKLDVDKLMADLRLPKKLFGFEDEKPLSKKFVRRRIYKNGRAPVDPKKYPELSRWQPAPAIFDKWELKHLIHYPVTLDLDGVKTHWEYALVTDERVQEQNLRDIVARAGFAADAALEPFRKLRDAWADIIGQHIAQNLIGELLGGKRHSGGLVGGTRKEDSK